MERPKYAPPTAPAPYAGVFKSSIKSRPYYHQKIAEQKDYPVFGMKLIDEYLVNLVRKLVEMVDKTASYFFWIRVIFAQYSVSVLRTSGEVDIMSIRRIVPLKSTILPTLIS